MHGQHGGTTQGNQDACSSFLLSDQNQQRNPTFRFMHACGGMQTKQECVHAANLVVVDAVCSEHAFECGLPCLRLQPGVRRERVPRILRTSHHTSNMVSLRFHLYSRSRSQHWTKSPAPHGSQQILPKPNICLLPAQYWSSRRSLSGLRRP